MRLSNLGYLVILTLVASCGDTGDGQTDTSGVDPETRGPAGGDVRSAEGDTHERSAVAAPAAEGMPRDAAGARLVGYAASRFVVFDTAERGVVFDAETARAYGLPGHPLTAATNDFDPWTEASFSPAGAPTRVVASADGSAMLVRTGSGVEAVDLRRGGAPLARWDGHAAGADVAPDGSAFVVATADRLDVVRTTDGSHASYTYRAGDAGAPDVRWAPGAAYWTDADGLHVVRTRSLDGLHAPLPEASAIASDDGSTFVAWRAGEAAEPGVVVVWRAGEAKPRSRIVSLAVQQVIVDRDGSRVAWSERAGDLDAPTFLHTLDVETGVHVRFASKARPCEIDDEHLVGFVDGALETDAECNPGCPSLTSQPELIRYDVATGRKLGERLGELVPAWTDEAAARLAAAEGLEHRFGVPRGEDGALPLVHHPREAAVVVAAEGGLRLAPTGESAAEVALANGAGFRAGDVHFTSDGTIVVAASEDGRVAAWSSSDGRLLWSWSGAADPAPAAQIR